ncbi:MAG: metalloregulator ArsR/SmtB family transcription factor [Candidatus Zixiibacteriota bacterium]
MAANRSSTRYKTDLYRQFARVGQAVANPRRLEILDLLSQGERTVELLAGEIGTTVSNVSQHLHALREAGLVESRKEGLYVHYSIAGEQVAAFWRALRALAIDVSAEARELVRSFIDERDTFESVEHDELVKRVESGDAVVIDVRPLWEYEAGHISGALSIPLGELPQRLGEVPSDREVVAYCRGPYCLLSVEAVELLRRHGIRARRLIDGLPEWRAAGRPTDRTEDGPQVAEGESARPSGAQGF